MLVSLAFLFAGSASTYEDKGDGIALGNFYERSKDARESQYFGEYGTELADYPGETKFVPADLEFRTADSERERKGYATTLQYRNPSNSLELTAEFIKSNATLAWDERVIRQGEQGFKVNPNVQSVSNATFDERGFMTSGTIHQNERSNAATRIRSTETDVEDSSLHLTYHINDDLRLDLDYQHVNSTFYVRDYTVNSGFINNDFTFSTLGDTPTVDYIGENLTTPSVPGEAGSAGQYAEVYLKSAMDKADDVDAESDSFAADLEYQIDSDWISSVKAGAYISTKKQVKRDSTWNWGEAANGTWQAYANGGQATAYQGTEENPGDPERYEIFTFNASDFHGGGVLQGDQSFLFPTLASVHDFNNTFAAGNTNMTQF